MAILFLIVGAVLGAVFYWVGRKLRTFGAWAEGKEGPTEKTVVFLPLSSVAFGVMGYLAADPVEKILVCRQVATDIVTCLI